MQGGMDFPGCKHVKSFPDGNQSTLTMHSVCDLQNRYILSLCYK